MARAGQNTPDVLRTERNPNRRILSSPVMDPSRNLSPAFPFVRGLGENPFEGARNVETPLVRRGGESAVAVIVGGGEVTAIPFPNRAGLYGFVGGGLINTAAGAGSVVGGGTFNTTTGTVSVIGGGNGNQAIGGYSAIGGGLNNIDGPYQHALGYDYGA